MRAVWSISNSFCSYSTLALSSIKAKSLILSFHTPSILCFDPSPISCIQSARNETACSFPNFFISSIAFGESSSSASRQIIRLFPGILRASLNRSQRILLEAPLESLLKNDTLGKRLYISRDPSVEC